LICGAKLAGKSISVARMPDRLSRYVPAEVTIGEKKTNEGELSCPNGCKQAIVIPEPNSVVTSILYDACGKQIV